MRLSQSFRGPGELASSSVAAAGWRSTIRAEGKCSQFEFCENRPGVCIGHVGQAIGTASGESIPLTDSEMVRKAQQISYLVGGSGRRQCYRALL